jgi:protein CpxP
MKKLLLTLLLTLPLGLLAQRHHHKGEKMTSEQQGKLKAKAMRLHLDLSENQEQEVQKIFVAQMENIKAHRKKAKSEGLSEYERKLHFLDSQLALREQMKSILTAEQYEKWKKVSDHKSRQRKMAMKRKKEIKQHYNPKRKW